MIFSFVQTVFAYSFIDTGYYDQNVPIDTSTYVSSEYTTPVNKAVNSWNNASIPRQITQTVIAN